MNINAEKISAAVENSLESGPVYYEIDSRMKCEFLCMENKLRLIVCLYRSAQGIGQLQSVLQKRHALPDRYANIKIGTDGHMNLYAGKTIVYIAPTQVIKELESICEFITQ